MSKLSQPLKNLINATAARPATASAPSNIRNVYERLAQDARSKGVGKPSWLAISTAATMTMNSPASLSELYGVATTPGAEKSTAEFMREVGLKCISFNGIPRTINCLGEFRQSLPQAVRDQLSTKPTRKLESANAASIVQRGQELWDSVYSPLHEKLEERLSQSHPDLPVVIMQNHYGALLSNPAEREGLASVGRVLTSVVAVACLRAQSGAGPQVVSHVFGLRKAFEDNSYKDDAKTSVGAKWLASNEGSIWLLESVDNIVEAISGGEGANFAPKRESKL